MATSVQPECSVSKVCGFIQILKVASVDAYIYISLCPERFPCFTEGEFSVVNVTYEDFLGQFTGGGISFIGRVAVCLNGVFGSVCDVDWDQNDATVLCNSDFAPDGDYGEYSLKVTGIASLIALSYGYLSKLTCLVMHACG